jgi:hypothetical protein
VHVASAPSAHHQPLEQRGPLAWRTATVAAGDAVGGDLRFDPFVVGPAPVALVMVDDQGAPLLAGHRPDHPSGRALAVGDLAGLGAAVGERAGVAGVEQQIVGQRVVDRPPRQTSVTHPGQLQAVVAHRQGGLAHRAVPFEPPEQLHDRLTHRNVGALDHPVALVVDVAGRQRDPQLTLGGLVAQPRDQPALDQVQLRFRDRALQPSTSRSE